MSKIKEINNNFELGVKRLYVPFKVKFNCPHCNSKLKIDLSQDYLSYPTVNKFEEQPVYCEGCEQESFFDLKLTMKIEVSKIRKDENN